MNKKYKGYLIDLDGTIYNGKKSIPAAKIFIENLQKRGIPFLFVTNNSTRTPSMIVDNLDNNFDIHVSEKNIYTSAMATSDYIYDLNPNKHQSVYIIGEIGLKKALLEKHFILNEINPDFVIVGLDKDLTYHKLEIATLAVLKGSKLIGTNPDTNLPSEHGMIPSTGSILSSIEYATKKHAMIVGKPNRIIIEKALKKLNVNNNDVLMVGDNYNTDIMAGINFGIDTLIVYTGVSTPKEIDKVDIKPTYSVTSLSEWII